MSTTRAILSHIAAETSLTLATDLFEYMDEDQADTDTAVWAMKTITIDRHYFIPGNDDFVIRFLSRSRSRATALSNINAVIDLFHGRLKANTILPVVISGETWRLATAELFTGPLDLTKDSRGRFLFSADIRFRVQLE